MEERFNKLDGSIILLREENDKIHKKLKTIIWIQIIGLVIIVAILITTWLLPRSPWTARTPQFPEGIPPSGQGMPQFNQ
jgi:hypothetical protein